MRVLVVDDEPLVRRALERAFQRGGHNVVLASDGTAGLSEWSKAEYDLVLVDVLMPGLNGPQLLKEMAKVRPLESSHVLLMSAYSGDYNMESAQKMGARGFISKPFEDVFDLVTGLEREVVRGVR